MPQYRVWLHDDLGIQKPGHHDVEAATAKAAAEAVIGLPVSVHGPLWELCARVASMDDLASLHCDGFFRVRKTS